jgi:hypothetical protein
MTDPTMTMTFTNAEWSCILNALSIANAMQYDDKRRTSIIERIVAEFDKWAEEGEDE